MGLGQGFDRVDADILAALDNALADMDDSTDQNTSREPDIDHDTVDNYILRAGQVGPDPQHDGEMWMQKEEDSTTKDNKSSKSDYIENPNKNPSEGEAGQGKAPNFAKGALVNECVLHQAQGVHSEHKRPSTNMAPPTKNQDETPAKKKRF